MSTQLLKTKENRQTAKQEIKNKPREQETNEKGKKIPRRRVFPIWLRLIVILILVILSLILGLIIGYGVIGDGSPMDVLKLETWQHIIDIVNKVD